MHTTVLEHVLEKVLCTQQRALKERCVTRLSVARCKVDATECMQVQQAVRRLLIYALTLAY
jgi:hypothetical protein|eukprot:12932-Heterococcus_DN1.PRE.4